MRLWWLYTIYLIGGLYMLLAVDKCPSQGLASSLFISVLWPIAVEDSVVRPQADFCTKATR